MKVITEERLREIQSSIMDGRSKLFMRLLINECQEIDTLSVSKLRLMSEHCKDRSYIDVFYKHSEAMREAIYFEDGIYIVDGHQVHESELTGWLPRTTYKPE